MISGSGFVAVFLFLAFEGRLASCDQEPMNARACLFVEMIMGNYS